MSEIAENQERLAGALAVMECEHWTPVQIEGVEVRQTELYVDANRAGALVCGRCTREFQERDYLYEAVARLENSRDYLYEAVARLENSVEELTKQQTEFTNIVRQIVQKIGPVMKALEDSPFGVILSGL